MVIQEPDVSTPRYCVERRDDVPLVTGKRDWLTYQRFSVEEASGARAAANITSSERAFDGATGWHYHTCECQFVYVLEGWYDMQYADGKTIRYEEGTFAYIPGGTVHNEIRSSEGYKVLEIHLPADLGTVEVETPLAWQT